MTMYFKTLFEDKKFAKRVVIIIIPVMIQQLIISGVNLIDNLMVGQLKDDALLSAVAASNQYYFIANLVITGMIGSCIIYLAQYYGAKKFDDLKETFRFTLVSSFFITIIFALVALFFAKNIILFFRNDAKLIEYGVDYLTIVFLSYFPLAISLSISSVLKAIGETKIPVFISSISVLTNTFLNYLLIFGNFGFPFLGVKGAAIATVIARFVEVICYLYVVKKHDYPFKFSLNTIFDFTFDLARKIFQKALPLIANEFFWSLGMTMIFKFYASKGVSVMSGNSIAETISNIFFILFGGMSVATTIIVGHQLGEGNIKKAKNEAYKLVAFSVLLAVFFGSLLYISGLVVPHYYQVSQEAKNIACDFLKIKGCFFWIYMFVTQCYFIMRAGGDTKSTFIMDSCFMWTVTIPIVYIVTYLTSLNVIAIFLINQLTDIIKLLVANYFLRKEKWVKNLSFKENLEVS